MALDAGSVYVTLGGRFDTKAFSAFDVAIKRSAGVASKAEKAIVGSMGRKERAMRSLGTVAKGTAVAGIGAVGVAAGVAGFAIIGAARKAMTFEAQMKSLRAVSGASRKELKLMSDQALTLGASTGIGATKAAQALTELAKGGVAVKDVGQALKGTLALAAAGELEVADAATMTANALNLFGLSGRDATKIADAFATAANATTADVGDFGMAISQGGAAAKAAGLSFQDTVVALEALAAAGVKNSDAGTSLKAALTQIANPTDEAAEKAKQLGLNFFTAEGKFKDLSDVSGMLRERLSGLTKQQRLQAVSTIAGTDGMRALLSLYDAGPAKIKKFEQGVRDQGVAMEVGRKKQEGAAGAIQRLKASFETAQIIVGRELLPTIAEEADKAAKKLQELAQSGDLKKFGQDLAQGMKDGANALKDTVKWLDKTKDKVSETVSDVDQFFQDFEKYGQKGGAIDMNKFARDFQELDRLMKAGLPKGFKLPAEIDFHNVGKVVQDIKNFKAQKIKVGVDIGDALQALRVIDGRFAKIKSADLNKAMRIVGDDRDPRSKIAALKALPMPPKIARILANSQDAETKLHRVLSLLNAARDKHINVTTTYTSVGSPGGAGTHPKIIRNAAGRAAGAAQTSLVGEGGGPEYVIDSRTGKGYRTDGPMLTGLGADDYVVPLEQRFRGRALGLFAQLAKDLGVPGYKGGKSPKPRQYLRLDPSEFEERVSNLESKAGDRDSKGHVTAAARRAKNDLPKARAIARAAREYADKTAGFEEHAEIERLKMENAERFGDRPAFRAARKRRGSYLGKALQFYRLARKKSKPGSKWRRTIDQNIQTLIGAQHDNGLDAFDQPAQSLEDLLTGDEATNLANLDRDLALAELTDGIEGPNEDRDILTRLLGTQEGILGRLQGAGAPADVIAEAARNVKSAREALAGLTSGSADADMQAQLDQANARADAAMMSSRINAGALAAFTSAGDLGIAGRAPNITIQTLHPGDPRTLDAIGRAATSGQGLQSFRRGGRVKVGAGRG